ncbi:hypothetical protein B296_00047437 [Ensete ventricosum]|uniref:Uncharacterized protein n=1 Tax=Ensete ventricosum TaxID=4639 RepID=A0A426XGX3_ENSVE|nr:hypothetical protein B296_00047437 [Ensete ventricosum]
MESIVKSKASGCGTPGGTGILVLILDYGFPYTHLITRRIRQLSVSLPLRLRDLHPRLRCQAEISRRHPLWRPRLRPRRRSPLVPRRIHRLIVQKLGEKVAVGERQEYGKMEMAVADGDWGLYGSEAIDGYQIVWMSLGDAAVKLSEGFSVVARSLQGSVAMIENYS